MAKSPSLMRGGELRAVDRVGRAADAAAGHDLDLVGAVAHLLAHRAPHRADRGTEDLLGAILEGLCVQHEAMTDQPVDLTMDERLMDEVGVAADLTDRRQRAHPDGARRDATGLGGSLKEGRGLDVDRARAVLDSQEFGEEVRAAEQFWQNLGILSGESFPYTSSSTAMAGASAQAPMRSRAASTMSVPMDR